MILEIFINKKNLLLLCLLITVLISKAANNDGTIPLVKNGKSNYSIITSPNANAREQRAASLLQDYIFKISGCKIPTSVSVNKGGNAIYINESANIKNRDGFSIKTKGKSLHIEGGNYKGCVYGVVTLLEKYLDCHYYSPFYKVIPTSKSINLPAINFSDEPVNEVRIINISDKVDEDFIDWNRLNTSDEYFAKGYYVHTFHRLVPWQENFKNHPEYFALMNGKRIIDQLCLTNPDVLKLVITKLEKDMAEQPDKLYWSVSQNDNFSYCQCDNCKKIISEEKSPSGPVIRFVNEVAKHFPTKIISTLAYQYSRQAPAITKPESNVQVMLCTIELNRSKSIETDPGSKSFVKDIVDWGKICKHIYLWDYTIDFAHSVSPFPNLHVLQPNIQFFNKNNVRAHFQQSNSMRGQEFAELKLYLISRIMWNPNINTVVVVDEFLNGYYGKAAPWIKKYITQLQNELIKGGEGLDIYGHPLSHKNSFLSANNINNYNNYFDEALRAVARDSAQLMHVKITRLPLLYAIMEIGKTDMYGARGWYQEKNGEYLVNEKMKAMLEDFNATCLQAGVVRLNEGGLTPQDYYASTQRFLNIQVKGNLAFRKKVTASTAPAPQFSGGDLAYLTNGVRGANDHKVHWLGWEGKHVDLTLDLEQPISATSIEISSLYDPQRWILHPAAVTCLVSENGKDYTLVGTIETAGNQKTAEITKLFKFDAPKTNFRYVKFEVKGTIHLFDWHPAPNGTSWMFIDEIIVR
jgi:hypothetical protein